MWYVACTPDEIDGRPIGRKICGEQMVLFPSGEGKVAALDDFCPHRGALLSLGFLRDSTLVCGYHGLAMGCAGEAVSMPDRGSRASCPFEAIRRWSDTKPMSMRAASARGDRRGGGQDARGRGCQQTRPDRLGRADPQGGLSPHANLT
ncbi:Rieske 2Fe-2S domain-containing protein [Sphingobium ummariense]|uniref:Rieske 2Fe-2S domain-containing protein n=1 Tax=Sphingobium ummariense TaxID=420994 RepID=UPI001F3A1310|nr:Rieske 2Fe-2S domain-containing protein [Sphingobium ummariense]